MSSRKQHPITDGRGGFLTRLARDKRGNTLAMMAALLIPLLVMVGSGVDMARSYMAKAKLQTACDSAAIAARRMMGSGAFSTEANAEGLRFFNFNFPQGTMGTSAFTPVVRASARDASVVEVTAATRVPTTIMAFFGYSGIDIDVACEADKDYVNNDIMLVLDVTGSMNCTTGNPSCSYQATEQANSRIDRLRNAAGELYNALDDATGVRTRYGFMPFSMTVNVGRDMQNAWLNTTAVYHNKNCTNPSPATNGWRCTTGGWVSSSGWSTTTITRTTAQLDTMRASAAGFCVEERSSIGSTGSGTGVTISSAVSDADINQVGGTDAAFRWQPYDDVNTRFEHSTIAANLARFCPRPAQRLNTYDTVAAFNTALLDAVGRRAGTPGYNAAIDGAAVGGYTNHDLGLMWGMRYLSGGGMFAADNPDEWDATTDGVSNPVRVDRHLIFLTDGQMTADPDNYSAYGIPRARNRTGSSSSISATQLETQHINRLNNACARAREMGFTVWVIVLDVADPSDVRGCAATPNHFFVSDGTNLDDIFELIGKGIGRLRLVG